MPSPEPPQDRSADTDPAQAPFAPLSRTGAGRVRRSSGFEAQELSVTADETVPRRDRPHGTGPWHRLRHWHRRSRWSRSRPVRAAVIVAVAALVIAVVVGVRGSLPGGTTTAGAPTETSSPSPTTDLRTGGYLITALHSGQCLGEGPEIGNEGRTVIVQNDCDIASPPTGLEALDGELFRITLDHPVAGPGCVTIDAAQADVLFHGYHCEKDAQQLFSIVPLEEGFALRLASEPELCLGIMNADTAKGTQAISAPCGSPGQAFGFAVRP